MASMAFMGVGAILIGRSIESALRHFSSIRIAYIAFLELLGMSYSYTRCLIIGRYRPISIHLWMILIHLCPLPIRAASSQGRWYPAMGCHMRSEALASYLL